MEADPSETRNIATENADIVAQLSAQYDAWFTDISHDPQRRLPLPVGYPQHNPVELHAPQAYLDKPLKFASGPGFSNDWITGWTDTKGKLWFDLEIATAGSYEIELAFASLPADSGSRLRISVGSESLEMTIPPAPAPEIPLPNRDEAGMTRYRNREWGTLKAGALKLPAGPAKITLEPLSMPGAQVMDFKHLKLSLDSAQ
jgi:arylsulfatase A